MPDIIQQHKKEFERVVERFSEDLKTVKTGRATPALIESILVSVYGASTRLQELASILVNDPQTLCVQPWDKNITNEIVRAIANSKIGLSAIASPQGVLVKVPALTEETRREIAKVVQEKVNAANEQLRHVRDEAREHVLKAEKNKEIAEDARYKFQDKLDEMTREYQNTIQTMKEKKVVEVMRV
jgi:ribosome recycling factor